MEQIIRKATPTAALLITACSMLGCSDVGIDPPLDRFFNPVALAVDPDGAFLLVANGDFGLAYTSATVVPVDLRKVGQALDDEGLRAGSELQGGPKVVTDALGELAELAVRIGAFAGRMRIDPTGRAAYVSSRRDSTIYALGLQRNGSGQLARIDCGGPDEPLQQCAGIHRLRGHAASDPDTALREPFGFDFLPQLPPAPDRAPRGLMAAYLRSGDLVLFPLDPQTSLPRPGAVQEHLDLQFPSRDVVVHPDGRQAWVTSRLGDELRVIRLPISAGSSEDERGEDELGQACGDQLCDLPAGETKDTCPADCAWKDLGLQSTGSSGSSYGDTRAVVVSPDGARLYVARRHVPIGSGPASADLAVLQRSYAATGNLRLDVIGIVPLPERPIAMTLWPGNGTSRPDLLFAVCYDSGTLVVIDAAHLTTIASLVVGKTPYDIALAPRRDDEAAPAADGRGLAYISHVRGNELSVVDIDPESANWLKVVGKIRGGGQ